MLPIFFSFSSSTHDDGTFSLVSYQSWLTSLFFFGDWLTDVIYIPKRHITCDRGGIIGPWYHHFISCCCSAQHPLLLATTTVDRCMYAAVRKWPPFVRGRRQGRANSRGFWMNRIINHHHHTYIRVSYVSPAFPKIYLDFAPSAS